MNLSPGEKLITLMLCDLFKSLNVSSDFDPDFLSEAIRSGNLWALERTYSGIATTRDEIGADVVKRVHDTLDMYEILETSYAGFSAAEKTELENLAGVFGKDIGWPGFDGNHEGEYRRTARFMIEEMNYHSHFKGRADLNSHGNTLETTERMLEVYATLRDKLGFGGKLSVQDVADILNAQTYPGDR